MPGKPADLLAFRHRRPPFHPGQDQRLADSRQGVFLLQGCRRGKAGAYARHNVKLDILLAEGIHLFLNGTINGGVACVEAHRHLALFFRLFNGCHHFIQRHGSGVMNLRILAAVIQQLRIHQ